MQDFTGRHWKFNPQVYFHMKSIISMSFLCTLKQGYQCTCLLYSNQQQKYFCFNPNSCPASLPWLLNPQFKVQVQGHDVHNLVHSENHVCVCVNVDICMCVCVHIRREKIKRRKGKDKTKASMAQCQLWENVVEGYTEFFVLF